MIDRFRGNYEFLSNFYRHNIIIDGLIYPSVENFFQAMKTTDLRERKIFQQLDPADAKRRGRDVELRADWDDLRISVMKIALEAKFIYDIQLANQLMSLGDQFLIEGNIWHDNFWGDCICSRCVAVEGQNNLGYMLMELRDRLITINHILKTN